MAFRDWFRLKADTGGKTATTPVVAQEAGASGTENFGGYIRGKDPNPQFDDYHSALLQYDKMRRTDAQVQSILRVIKLPLLAATWTCQPPTDDPADQQIADFCNSCLFTDEWIKDSWDFILQHILLQLEFGVSAFEKVWMVDHEGHYRLRRLAPRLPNTYKEWHVNRGGELLALVQYAPIPHSTKRVNPSTGGYTYTTTSGFEYLTIPADYLAVFTSQREGDNYEGVSLLRPIYRNYWFKDQAYRSMAVGLDRWSSGIPVGRMLPDNSLTPKDKQAFAEMLRRIRNSDQAYMVLPEGTDFAIEPSASGGGAGTLGSFGIEWIDHHDGQMARSVLANFLTMGQDSYGTLGFGSRMTDLFVSSLNGIAEGISGDLKRDVIRPLCDLNFDMTKRQYPVPVCMDLEKVDMEAMIQVLGTMSGTFITPQDDDERILRKMMGLSPLVSNPRAEAAKAAESARQDPAAIPVVESAQAPTGQQGEKQP